MSGLVSRLKRKVIIPSAVYNANEDLLPTPPEHRLWTWWNYSAIWAGLSFDATWWNVGSAFIGVGLTVSQTIAPVLIGSLLLGVGAVLNSSFGAHYHIGFPAMIRPTFGVVGSRWFVFMRGIIGIVWYAVQVYYCGQLFNVMFICAFGQAYIGWNPRVPSSAGTDAKTMLVYFLAWGISFPLVLIHPSKLRNIFNIRAVIAGPAFISVFIWCTILAHKDPRGFKGFGILQSNPITGPAVGWAIMSSINSVLGTAAPMITNQSDVSRYARDPRQSGWPQGVTIFVARSIMSFLSIVATASLQSRYGGTAKWNIWEQLALLLDENWNAKTRFGCFIISLCVSFSVLVTNAYGNSIPFGADISSLFPKYLNIVRGQVIIALISLPVLPWQILVNAQAFLTFLGSYTFLMGALLGCQWGDFIIRKGNYHVPSLYNYGRDTIYMFSPRGYNWRGFVSWLATFAFIFPGLIAQFIPNKMSQTPQKIYDMGWILGVSMAMFFYIVLNKLFPVSLVPREHTGAPETKRWLGMSPIHGFFPGDFIPGQEDVLDDTGSSTLENEKDVPIDSFGHDKA